MLNEYQKDLIRAQEEGFPVTEYFQNNIQPLRPDMTVLAVLQWCRQTEAVFRKYEAESGSCIMCNNLFDPLTVVAHTYGLDLEQLLADLEKCAGSFPDVSP